MPVCIFLNVLCLIILYGLLCNTAIIKTNKQDDGRYLYDKVYIIGDIIKPNNMDQLTRGVVLFILCLIPITWVVCVSILTSVFVAYLTGYAEVFGKNKKL